MRLVVLFIPILLWACSSERIEALRQRQEAEGVREVQALVHDGMSVAEAVPALQRAGFVCEPHGDVPPSFACGRQRQLGWTVASCVQQVTFVDTLVDHGAIAGLAISPLTCVGP